MDWAPKAAGQKHSGTNGECRPCCAAPSPFRGFERQVDPPALQRAEDTDEEGWVALSGGRSGGLLITRSAPKTERTMNEGRGGCGPPSLCPGDRGRDYYSKEITRALGRRSPARHP
ncbi:hypothetical protein NDU88_003816 [Pleurodeles waltl]|uniref:Uncharacterized protein n=1 Tax=Pleurodeles waltl TaxID=8319 RepID=A0AAV7NLP7_PLEWA|nr:hypothetical protein NDU88_003816 [Pleurodeles waltl]